MEQKVLAYMDAHKDELFEMLSGLIKIDTQNFRTHGNENDGQDYLEKRCKEIGLPVDRFTPDSIPGITENEDFLFGRGTDKRENLVAVLEGEENAGGIMMAAHMDTMPFGDLTKWNDPPLSGVIKNGNIYGRGAGDDKSGIALSWFVLKALKECGFKPKKNVYMGAYIDEEYGGGNGTLGMCLKYPCDCYINLDGSQFEEEALGGGCFALSVNSVKQEKGIASVFNVFDSLHLALEEIKKLDEIPGTKMRLTSFSGGDGGAKIGKISFAIYTTMTRKEANDKFAEIFEGLKPKFKELEVVSDGFVQTTRFFAHGITEKGSKEADVLRELFINETGTAPNTKGTCLSDLSLYMRYGSMTSFNFGIPRGVGSEGDGGAHQPNENVCCAEFIKRAKYVAQIIMRTL